MNLLNIEHNNNPERWSTLDDTPVHVTEDFVKNFGLDGFDYYRDLYINNVNTSYYRKNPNSTQGQYIITETARGPKNYLRNFFHWYHIIWQLKIVLTLLRTFLANTMTIKHMKIIRKGIWFFLFHLWSDSGGRLFEDGIGKWLGKEFKMFLPQKL